MRHTDEKAKRRSKNRFEIELLSSNYINSKRIIAESEENIITISSSRLSVYRKIVYHIEYVVAYMNEIDKLIIENEVLKGKRGKWYRGIMSTPSYYRYREKAYSNFLRCL